MNESINEIKIGGTGLVRDRTFTERRCRYYRESDKIFYGSGNSQGIFRSSFWKRQVTDKVKHVK